MNRPTLEVAEIIRAQGDRFLNRYEKNFSFQQLKVFRAIERCRTAALGGHIDTCSRCGYQTAISYNSCRNRHCPKCQALLRQRWLAARERELLATSYFHTRLHCAARTQCAGAGGGCFTTYCSLRAHKRCLK